LGAALVGLIGWIATHPQDAVTDISLVVHAIQRPTAAPANLVVFMSDEQRLPSKDESILEQSSYFHDRHFSFERWYPDADKLQALKDRHPLVVVFGAAQADADLPELPDDVKQYLRSGVKVIGMGVWAGRIFQQLAPNSLLAIGNQKAVASSDVVLGQTRDGLPTDAFPLYSDNEAGEQMQAIYDNGPLSADYMQLIAHTAKGGGSCIGHYWPVAQDQNFLFWGFTGTRLTPEGETLFASLLDHIAQLPVDAQPPRDDTASIGQKTETLACDFPIVRYQLHLSSTQALNIKVRSKDRVEVVLTGPGTLPPIVRIASAGLPFQPITQHGVRGDDNWLLTITYSGEMTQDTVDIVYLTMMLASDPPPLIVLVGIPIGSIVLVGVVLLAWVRRRDLIAVVGARWGRQA
jgi:hypothetical protein